MNVLAIDTATPYLVLGTLEHERALHRGRRHAETLPDDLTTFLSDINLSRSALELVVVGEGPGSYTGLRIGLAFALGLARGLGIPVVGASSMAAAATRARGRVRIVWEARNRQLYVADYHVGAQITELSGTRKQQDVALADHCLLWNAPPSGRTLAHLGAELYRTGNEGVNPLYL